MPDHPLDNLSRRLGGCMPVDRERLRRQIRQLRRQSGNRGPAPNAVEQIESALTEAVARREQRLAGRPELRYPHDLPIVEKRDEVVEAIRSNQTVVVCGETGSGKTTQLPKMCLEAGRGVEGLIGHTQPRRIAARTIAARVAEELGQPLGQGVGYTVRFTDRTPSDAYIKLMTDGILLAETRRDRRLLQYDTIIIDEAHERSLNIDFLLGYLKQLLPRRPDLKLIITSATIDPQRFSDHFDGAPIIEVSGRTYPVDVRYRPPEDDDDPQRAILEAVDEIAAEQRGDVLVFLPGEREIRETAEALRKHHPPHTEILPLFARLSVDEQNRVFQQHSGRRIVLATNVAETSLTVPGIMAVVDTGVARISRYSARRGVQLLPIEGVSQASARQRAGRCGRLGPGVCVRLYEESDFEGREAFTPPEILRTSLASVILQMHALGLGDIEKFPFVDAPKKGMIRDGQRTLHELGALDDDDRLTPIGRQLARLPVDPRIGRMIIEAAEGNCLTEVLIIAAALSVQDPRQRPSDRPDAADEAHAAFRDESSDFMALLNIWRFYHERKKHLSWSKLRKCCAQNFLSYLRMREWVDVHGQLKRIANESGMRPNREPASADDVHRALLAGLMSHIGMLDQGREYLGGNGKRFHIFPGSALFKSGTKWVVAAELVETSRLYARIVTQIKPQWLERLAPHLLKRSHTNPRWSEKSAQVIADEKVSLFGLPIVPQRRVHYGPIDPRRSRELFLHHALVEGEFQTNAPYARHNQALVDEIEAMQDRLRQRNLLADTALRYGFFDRRIPADVYSGSRFERWRKQAERRDPNVLFMQRSDLVVGEVPAGAGGAYPETMSLGDAELHLDYHFEPGHADDGVTLTVPLGLVERLDVERLEWLVPGLLEEKIVALLRALPKPIRRQLVPVPDTAARCMDALGAPSGSLTQALGQCLHRQTGVEVPPDAWNLDAVPDHLRMRIQVIGDDGQELAQGREARTLQRDLGAHARAALETATDDQFAQDGLTEWSFDALPECIEIMHAGARLNGFPTLIDAGDSVQLRVSPDEANATRTMRGGVCRLLVLNLRGALDEQRPALPGLDTMALHAAPVGQAEELHDQLDLLTVARACLRDGALPRTPRAFEACVDRGFSNLWAAGLEVVHEAAAIFEAFHEYRLALDRVIPEAWRPSVADIEDQMHHLMPARVLTRTDPDWLGHLARFIRGATARFGKLAHGGHRRDQRQMDELRPWWERYTEAAATAPDPLPDALHDYRWMLEELRISMFAQELRTSMPVSLKRIREQWDAVLASS